MSGETEKNVSGWTIDTLSAYQDAMRMMQDKIDAERDRRYTEVKNAEEKALKIKEEADKSALALAREIQTYKDEKANQLREQISSERGLYPTKGEMLSAIEKVEATIKPLTEALSRADGRGVGYQASRSDLSWIVSIIVGLIVIGTFIFVTVRQPAAAPQVIYVPSPAGTLLPTTPPQTVPR
jgi:hypothetical protein